MADEYNDLLNAHLLTELQRYLPNVTEITVNFNDDGNMTIIADPVIELTQINAGDSDAEWFVFVTDHGTYLTLPLFIED